MHFFYLDESGDSGRNLDDFQQPLFVLAGLSVADKKWNNIKDSLDKRVTDYFNNCVTQNFELHSHELLSPQGEGPFAQHPIDERIQLAYDLLKLIDRRGHHIHYLAIDKAKMKESECNYEAVFDLANPYLLAFEYLITYMNWHVKNNLGQSARGMIVMDEKDEHDGSVESIIHNHRYDVPKTHKVKWIVEFSYPVDSRRNPMIQLSDLIALCTRRFLEIELGYKNNTPDIAKNFYAKCFDIINCRLKGKKLIERDGRREKQLNEYIASVNAAPSRQWRRKYEIEQT